MKNKGFSLLEMAMVVLALSVLMMGVLELAQLSHKIEMTRQTKATLDKLVKDSIGYAINRGVLPATIDELGTERMTDAWGKKITYKVNTRYQVQITAATQSKLCIQKYSVDCTGDRSDDLYVAAYFTTNTPLGEFDSYVSEKELKYYMISGQAIYP